MRSAARAAIASGAILIFCSIAAVLIAIALSIPSLSLFPSLSANPSHTSPWGKRGISPQADLRLTIIGVGAWRGDFGTDPKGEDGLAALQAFASSLRQRLEKEGSQLLFVQVSDFSGAASREMLRRRLRPKRLDLLSLLSFDALMPSASELLLYGRGSSRLAAESKTPLLSYNWKAGPYYSASPAASPASDKKRGKAAGKAPAPPIRPFLLLQSTGSSHSFWISALQRLPLSRSRFPQSEAPLYAIDALDDIYAIDALNDLLSQFSHPKRPDLILLGLESENEAEPETEAESETEAEPETESEPEAEPETETEPELLSYPGFSGRSLPPIVLLLGGARQNRFESSKNVLLCSIAGRSLCQINIRLRGERMISVSQRFIDLRSSSFPGELPAPKMQLLEALQ